MNDESPSAECAAEAEQLDDADGETIVANDVNTAPKGWFSPYLLTWAVLGSHAEEPASFLNGIMNDPTPTPPPPPANAPSVSVSAIEALKSPTYAGQDNALASPKGKGNVIKDLSNLRAYAQIRNMYFHIYFSTDQYTDCGEFL